MAEALIRAQLVRRGSEASVSSAGFYEGGAPASAGSKLAMTAYDLDLDDHRSRRVTEAMAAAADLVIGMQRRHVRELVVASPDLWPHTFTLKDLVRRSQAVDARDPDMALVEWLSVVGRGRSGTDLIGDDPDDDVADPMGGPDHLYASTAAEINDLVAQFVDVASPPAVNTTAVAHTETS